MKVLIDADALPRAAKDIVFRSAARLKGVEWTFVANKRIYLPQELGISLVVVEKGPDEADDRIVELAGKGDLIISSDVPLSDRAIAKGAVALSPKGQLLTEANVKGRLATRNLLDQLRNEGAIKGGGSPLSPKEVEAFANQLDRILTRRLKEEAAPPPAPKGFGP